MKNNNNNENIIKIIPILHYPNAELSKKNIYAENRLKPGIYCLNNIITNEKYVGSSVSLSRRFRAYYSLACLNKKVNSGSSLICRALLKYGHFNFSLDILEYCEPDKLISREQYYIDLINPEYNILKKAGSLLGFKHSEATKAKMSINNSKKRQSHYGKSLNEETILGLSIKSKTALTVEIKDINTNVVKIFINNV